VTELQSAMEEASVRMAEVYESAEAINEGGCFEWATEVISMVDCKIVARTYLGGYHCFIEYRRKFYDSETPQGIVRWQSLPYFKRCRADRVAGLW
jgi:hypothetical protein